MLIDICWLQRLGRRVSCWHTVTPWRVQRQFVAAIPANCGFIFYQLAIIATCTYPDGVYGLLSLLY